MNAVILFVSLVIAAAAPASDPAAIRRDIARIEAPAELLHNHPYAGGDERFWAVVKHGRAALPQLVDLLTNTTRLKTPMPYCGGYYTKADAADYAIEEIVHIPTWDFLDEPYRSRAKKIGFCAKQQFLRASRHNRAKYQARLREWLLRNERDLVWVPTAGDSPTGGYWSLRTNN